MSQKTNYFKLGIFIIIAIVFLLVGIFFLGAREMFQAEWQIETYIDQSVQGLDVGSPVKMMGVKIGAVQSIGFVYEKYDTDKNYVYVLFSINPKAMGARRPEMKDDVLREAAKEMTKKGLRLTLSSQGITGISFLDASFYKPDELTKTKLEIDWTPEHPYLPSVPGTLSRLSTSLTDTLDSISQVDFAGLGKKIDQSLGSIQGMLEDEIKPTLVSLKKEASPSLQNLRVASEKVPELTARLNLILQSLYDMINDQKGGLAEINENIRMISENLRQLTEKADRNPSQVLFGEPPPPAEGIN